MVPNPKDIQINFICDKEKFQIWEAEIKERLTLMDDQNSCWLIDQEKMNQQLYWHKGLAAVKYPTC